MRKQYVDENLFRNLITKSCYWLVSLFWGWVPVISCLALVSFSRFSLTFVFIAKKYLLQLPWITQTLQIQGYVVINTINWVNHDLNGDTVLVSAIICFANTLCKTIKRNKYISISSFLSTFFKMNTVGIRQLY